MSPREVAWRLHSHLQDKADRFRLAGRIRRAEEAASLALRQDASSRFPKIESHAGDQLRDLLTDGERGDLVRRADQATRGELELLGGAQVSCGSPLQWNRDPKHGIECPMGFAPQIDYRDFREVGDCKWVWEPARCHHWVVLGRAYRLTGEGRYAQAVCEQWSSWLEQCPFGRGMHWRSPLELGIRLINWAWAYALIEPARVMGDALRHRVWQSVELHLQEVARKYSRGSSANNHLIGEAAGVLIGSAAFSALPATGKYSSEAAAILEQEIQRQVLPDGVNAERATGYHFFVLQFFVLAGLAMRAVGRDFSSDYWKRVRAQFEYMFALFEGGEPLPYFNDADDGYVLDLGGNPRNVRPWLRAGIAMFPDLAERCPAVERIQDAGETAFWLVGDKTPPAPGRTTATFRLRSRAFPDGGVYLLQSGGVSEDGDDDRISVAIDCGPLGYGSIAAHGHADALSFTLRVGGVEVLSDPGTYDYFTHPEWRNYLRSTAAHNTVTVDEQDQSERLGLFLWGKRAVATREVWRETLDGGCLIGHHDGYRRLRNPVTHRRRIELKGDEQLLEIEDLFEGEGEHTICQHWHLSEFVRMAPIDRHGLSLDLDGWKGRIEWDPGTSAELVPASPEKPAGWISRGYHLKQPSATLVTRGPMRGNTRFLTRITFVQGVQMDDAEDVSESRNLARQAQ